MSVLKRKIIKRSLFTYGPAYHIAICSSIDSALSITSVNSIIYLPLFRRIINNKAVYVLYDESGQFIDSFYSYINSEAIFNLSENSRSYIVTALRRFHEFLSIYSLTIPELDSELIGWLKQFLSGQDIRNHLDYASTETVNRYLGIITDYIRFLGYEKHELFRQKTFFYNSKEIKKNAYNYPTSNNSIEEVPCYISINEACKLMKAMQSPTRKLYTGKFLSMQKQLLIKENKLLAILGKPSNNPNNPTYDELAVLLFRLMYGYGLRLGEALGLTNEDIVVEQSNTGELRYYIILRNRLSDRPYQYCKNLIHVKTRFEYNSKNYKGSLGTCRIQIDENLFHALRSYIERTIPVFKALDPVKFESSLFADSVEEDGHNYYIFIGINGARLSDDCWNGILRSYFIRAGIHIDEKIRDKNLSHRLRHGYAMFIVSFIAQYNEQNKGNPNNPPLGLVDLQRALRHRSIASCHVYYSKEIGFEIKINQKMSDEFYKTAPNLSFIFNEQNISGIPGEDS